MITLMPKSLQGKPPNKPQIVLARLHSNLMTRTAQVLTKSERIPAHLSSLLPLSTKAE